MERKCCKNCFFSVRNEYGELVCKNENSNEYGEFIDKNCLCPKWLEDNDSECELYE